MNILWNSMLRIWTKYRIAMFQWLREKTCDREVVGLNPCTGCVYTKWYMLKIYLLYNIPRFQTFWIFFRKLTIRRFSDPKTIRSEDWASIWRMAASWSSAPRRSTTQPRPSTIRTATTPKGFLLSITNTRTWIKKVSPLTWDWTISF